MSEHSQIIILMVILILFGVPLLISIGWNGKVEKETDKKWGRWL